MGAQGPVASLGGGELLLTLNCCEPPLKRGDRAAVGVVGRRASKLPSDSLLNTLTFPPTTGCWEVLILEVLILEVLILEVLILEVLILEVLILEVLILEVLIFHAPVKITPTPIIGL